MVTSYHLHVNSGIMALRYRCSSFRARRIHQSHHPEQCQRPVHICHRQIIVIRFKLPGGDRQHSLTVHRQSIGPLQPILRVDRFGPALTSFLVTAHADYLFGRTLGKYRSSTLVVIMQSGHETVLCIEGNDVHSQPLGPKIINLHSSLV